MRGIGLPQEREPGARGVSENQLTVHASSCSRAGRKTTVQRSPAAVAVVAAGAGAGVAGQPARQSPLLEEADLLQPDEVRAQAPDRGRACAGAQRPRVPPVRAEAGPYA